MSWPLMIDTRKYAQRIERVSFLVRARECIEAPERRLLDARGACLDK